MTSPERQSSVNNCERSGWDRGSSGILTRSHEPAVRPLLELHGCKSPPCISPGAKARGNSMSAELTAVERCKALQAELDAMRAEAYAMQRLAPRAIMNVEEAADYLRISVRQIHRVLKTGSIKRARIGKRLVFKRAELDHYVDLQTALCA